MALKSGRVGIHPSQVDPITGMLLSGPSGTSDYEQLSNLPKVNSVTLKGNKSLSDLGIPTSLAGQSDTDITDPAVGQILQYNGTGWENVYSSISPTTLATLQDVTITDPAAGQTLEYNGTGWKNVFASIAPTTLAALQDVDISSPADGDYLVYDSTSEKWINSGEAPAPTYTDVTCTFYGAVEDIISFTDAAGVSHLVTFAANTSSKQESFKIDPSGSSITFTSSVAKNPDDLSASYTKTVTVTSATTEIRVMPDYTHLLYWYGVKSSELQEVSTTNGWSGYTFVAPSFNKNDIGISGARCYVGTTGQVSFNKISSVMKSTALNSGTGLFQTISSAKTNLSQTIISNKGQTTQNTIELITQDVTQQSNFIMFGSAYSSVSGNIYALWYE